MPYVVQWFWPVPLFLAALFAPESPYWLVKKGRIDDAKRSLIKLVRSDYGTQQYAESQVALIQHTLEIEEAEIKGSGWREIFRGTNRRRTEIACVVWACQYWCGQPITGLATNL
jgi:SP family general alpha glucoside:H+ symporter-like MFS transporter